MRASRLTWMILVLACCDSDGPKSRGIKPPRHPPQGPYAISYDCLHSNLPANDGGDVRKVAVDLGMRTRTVLAYHYDAGSAQPRVTARPDVAQLTETDTRKLEQAVDRVLRGGPYQAEEAAPAGTPCTLSLSVSGATAFFQIAKAATEQPDAVSELVRSL